MKKLRDKGILDCLEEWRHRRQWMEEWIERDEQAYQQIVEIIRNVPWKKLELLLKLNEKLRVDKKSLIKDYKYALSKIPEKPEVTEELIDLADERLWFAVRENPEAFACKDDDYEHEKIRKNFIRKLVGEIQGVEVKKK